MPYLWGNITNAAVSVGSTASSFKVTAIGAFATTSAGSVVKVAGGVLRREYLLPAF